MFKKMLFAMLLIIGFVLIEVLRIAINPLTRSEEEIITAMLSHFPLGTHMDEVINYAENKKGWTDININYELGYRKDTVLGSKVGEKHISVYIGEYRIITNLYLITDVKVYFGFNENSKLIDIRVQKMIDAL